MRINTEFRKVLTRRTNVNSRNSAPLQLPGAPTRSGASNSIDPRRRPWARRSRSYAIIRRAPPTCRPCTVGAQIKSGAVKLPPRRTGRLGTPLTSRRYLESGRGRGLIFINLPGRYAAIYSRAAAPRRAPAKLNDARPPVERSAAAGPVCGGEDARPPFGCPVEMWAAEVGNSGNQGTVW